MFTVYLALNDRTSPSMEDVLDFVKTMDGAIFAGSSTDIRVALTECAANNPGVLILDDGLLIDNEGLIEAIATTPYPIVLLANPDIANVARRALAIHAADVVSRSEWQHELGPAVGRLATSLAGEARKPGRILSVFSSKGGSGKTTTAVNLSVALGMRAREPVVLVDLDVAFGDVAAMVGSTPQVTMYDLRDTEWDSVTVKKALTRIAPNVWILPAPLRPEEAEDIHSEDLVKLLHALKNEFTYVVVDMAPSYDELNVTALDMSDVILTICTPDVVTLRTVGQAIQLFREGFRYSADKVRLVLNRGGSHTGITSKDIHAILKNPVAYEFPSDGWFPVRAANDGVPLVIQYPNSSLAKAIVRVADAFIKEDFGNRRKRRLIKKSGVFSLFRK